MKRSFVDFEICGKCKKCIAECSYFYHPENEGPITLLELATRMDVCRKCEEAPCVVSCPKEALERQPDGTVRRYSMRCIACNTCTIACPFGVIYPEIIPYLTSQCDYCVGRLEDDERPICVRTCPEGAMKYIEIEESEEKDLRAVGDKLVVHSIPWKRP